MIGFEHYVSGSEIGRKLASDAEEMAYALVELADTADAELAADVAGYINATDVEKVCEFLRKIASQIADNSE